MLYTPHTATIYPNTSSTASGTVNGQLCISTPSYSFEQSGPDIVQTAKFLYDYDSKDLVAVGDKLLIDSRYWRVKALNHTNSIFLLRIARAYLELMQSASTD